MEMEKCLVGIDFGTTYSCVAVWKEGGLVIIPNGVGERTTPSVVIFDDVDKIFVGEETLYHLAKNDTVKICEIKRLLGKDYSDIKDMLKNFHFKIIKDPNSERPMIQMTFDKKKTVKYYPEDIATLILRHLIQNANNFLKQKVREVLITVPADFNEKQKNAVRIAAEKIDGLKVLQVINEPCAAVLAYGFPKSLIEKKYIPFNKYFTLLQGRNVFHPMEEMSISSSTHIDLSINRPIEEEHVPLIENENNINNISNDRLILRENQSNNLNINNEVSIKSSLMSENKDLMKIIVFDLGGGTYDVSVVYLDKDKTFETMGYNGDQKLGGFDFDNKLIDHSLKEFCNKNKYDEKIIRNNYKCMERLKRACEETKKYLSTKEEDTIIVEDFFDSKPLCCKITRKNFEKMCDDLFKRLIKPLDLLLQEKNLNNTDIDEIILVGGSSKIPKIKQIIANKFKNVPINDSINPDEVVAYGAIIYAESLRGFEGEFWKDFNYIDKTGHSIGIETKDGSIKVIVPKGTIYPVSSFDFFETVYDDQYTFDVRVFEGEGKFNYENELIGEFTLSDIPQRPKGEVILKVTVSIDLNQTITVTGFVNEGDIKKELIIDKKNQFPNLKNENIKLSVNSELNNEERSIQAIIFEYAKNFSNQKSDKDKYDLIKKYNEAMIKYLNFFENNYNDTSSEKYLYLLEKLFKSYTYYFNTSLIICISLGEKTKIKDNIELFLKKISNKAPFRIKKLLIHFKDIKNQHFIDRLEIFVFSMELLYNKAMNNYNKNEKNHILFAKTLFEECMTISNDFIGEKEKPNMVPNLMGRYKKLVEDCEKMINLISAISLSEIENLKIQGKLFDNAQKLENDDLNLLSYNLELAIKKINTIENLNQNQQALETKSFYLANIIKIEFLKKENKMNLERLEQFTSESLSIASNLNNCKNKPWYKELVKLAQEVETKIKNQSPAPPIENINDIEEKFMNLFNKGNEELLRYILKNYPYDNYKFTEQSINEYKKDKKKFLLKLRKLYSFNMYASNASIPINNINNNNPLVNNKILEFINKMLNNIDK